jgi:uncharacterized protein (TIGR02099 family)
VASFGRILWKWTAGIFAVLAIGLALVFGVFRIAVSHAPEYRQPVEARATEAIGLPVSIGQLDARLGLSGPEVVVSDALIRSEDGATTLLEVSTATVSLDLSELLLRWRIRWDAVILDGIVLDVTREADGQLLVLDRPLEDFKRKDPDRALPTGELRLLNSRLIFDDRAVGEDGGEPVLWSFEEVNLSITNRRDGMRVSGDFLPPPEAGERVVFWADYETAGGTWQSYAATRSLDFVALGRVRELAGLMPAGGRADLRVWVDGEARTATAARAEFELEDVALPPIHEPAAHPGVSMQPESVVEYQRLAGRGGWERTANGWKATVEDLDLARGLSSWRVGQASAGRSVKPLGGGSRIELAADYLRLDDLQPLVSRLPGETLRARLDAIAPSGEVRSLKVEVDSEPNGEAVDHQVTVEADLKGIETLATENLPGISGLSGRIRSDARGGRFEFAGDALTVDYPRLFREPLALDRSGGLMLWNFGTDGLILIGDGLLFGNPDLTLETGFRIRLADENQPGSIDFRAEVTDVDVKSAWKYLPVGIMTEKVSGWLDKALVDGRIAQAEVRIEGPLRGFPYREDQGEFRAGFTAVGLDLNYTDGWPIAEDLVADLLFLNEGLTAVVREGTLNDMDVDQVDVDFPDLKLGELTVKGRVTGPLGNVHSYLLDSPPVRTALDPSLSNITINGGEADVGVDLYLPIKDLPSRRVNVDIDVADGNVNYGALTFPLTNLQGQLRVRDTDVYADGLTARLVEQPAWIDVAPYEDLGVRANIRIETTGDALATGIELPLHDYLSGRTELRGILQFPRPGSGNHFWARYESDLEGLELSLPEPLYKPADEAVTFVIESHFPPNQPEDIRMVLGDEMGARLLWDITPAGQPSKLISAVVEGGRTDVEPFDGEGLFIRGQFDKISVDEWLEVRFGEGDGETSFEDWFAGVDLAAEELIAVGQYVDNVTVRMRPEPANGAWSIDIQSEAVAGKVTLPFELESRENAIILDMDRLAMFDDPRDGGGEAVAPTTVPPLRIDAREFAGFEIELGHLIARVDALPNGFEASNFTSTGPSFTVTGNLRSELGPGVDRSSLTIDLNSTDLSDTLEFGGFAPSVDANRGEFKLDVAWQGGLVPNLVAVAEGSASLKLGSGSLTEVKPGAGRVFGLLSVQALPRRLMLDFRDVFKKGFFFDEFGGDFEIANGEATTDNLKMKGRAADIGIIGTVQLVDREYDQTAVVSAQIGNTLPVVGAIAAGPIIGGGLFVLKEILKEPLREAGQVQYRITGPWENPQVVKVTDGEASGTQVSRSEGDREAGGG